MPVIQCPNDGEKPNPIIQQLLANLNSSGQIDIDLDKNLPIYNELTVPKSIVTPNSGSSRIPGLGYLPHSEPKKNPISGEYVEPRQSHPVQTQITDRNPSPAIPDASMITTWPAALKFVTKHLATNEKTVNRIRNLILEQHKIENQWWTEREALIAQQRARSGTSLQVAALLKSLGGKEMPMTTSDSIKDEAELQAFDKRVYKDLVGMAINFDKQLRAMGVPFYAIKHELVILEEGREKEGSSKGRIDKGELRELQKKMIQTLEDLFMD